MNCGQRHARAVRAAAPRQSPLSLRRRNAPICACLAVAEDSVDVVDSKDADSPLPEVGWLWDPTTKAAREQLRSINARPKKALGQNFIADANVLKNVTDHCGINPGDVVLEIGPGLGNLTTMLLRAGATVLAVEKDYKLAEDLAHTLQNNKKVKVIQGDILRVDIEEIIKQAFELHGPTTQERIKIVANLPYYITTDLLKQILKRGDIIESLVLLLQDEVSHRLTCEHPDVAAYRPMTVFSHFFSEPKYHFRIASSCFYPAPKVDGSLSSYKLLRPSERRAVRDEREFQNFVRQAFLSKRKLLVNSLQPMWSRETSTAALEALNLDPMIRPTDINAHLYVDLYNAACEIESKTDMEKAAEAAVEEE